MATFIVNNGIAIAIARLKGQRADTTAQPEPVFCAWGTHSPQVTTLKTDTGLDTETANATASRVTGTSSIVTSNPGTSPNNDTYQVVALLTVGSGTGAIAVSNAGIFDAASAGNLFMKGDFVPQNLNVGDAMQFTFKVVATSA